MRIPLEGRHLALCLLIALNSLLATAQYNSAENIKLERLTVFVKEGATGTGESWDNALGHLYEAINLSQEGYEGIDIWLAAGIYYPNYELAMDKRAASFVLTKNISIYGGFAGFETEFQERDFSANTSRLSGNFEQTDAFTDDTYKVVKAINQDSTVILDGLTISNGSTRSSNADDLGSGVYLLNSDIIIRNTIIENNHSDHIGGGVYMEESDPLFTNVKIVDNYAANLGAGLFLNESNPRFFSCDIANNKVYGDFEGGGLYLHKSNPVFFNSIISNNESGTYGAGGGLYCYESSPLIINSLVANNWSYDEGAGLQCEKGSHAKIINSIFLANHNEETLSHFFSEWESSVKVSYSNVQGGNKYGINPENYINNIDALNRFIKPSLITGRSVDALSADWDISSCSPCIDRGSMAISELLTPSIDHKGNSRIYGDSIDIGPFEYMGIATLPMDTFYIYVAPGGSGDGSSEEEATGDLQEALDTPLECYLQKKIILLEGVYVPKAKKSTLYLRNNTEIIGTLDTTWNKETDRMGDRYLSILSGDYGLDSDETNNSPHVITCNYLDSTSIINCIAIEDGYSAYGTMPYMGGGILLNNSNIILKNSIVRKNGGALYGYRSDITISNSQFIGNKTGCMVFEHSSPRLTNVMVMNNISPGGGGIDLRKSNLELVSCLIANNMGTDAGALLSIESTSSIINSTIVNNKGSFDEAGGIMCYDEISIQNSILWGNRNNIESNQIINQPGSNLSIKNSAIEGGNTYNIEEANYSNNISESPLFINPSISHGTTGYAEDADWSLNPSSPCINKGTLQGLTGLIPDSDMAGKARIFNDSIDMGAYEYIGFASSVKNHDAHSMEPGMSFLTYPNPAEEKVTLVINGEIQNLRVVLRNISGQIVFESSFTQDSQIDIPIEGPSGVYLLEISTIGGNTATSKIIKR